MIAIITAGIAPGLAILSYFYLKDQYEMEPLYMVVRTFIFGALLVFPIMFIEYVLETENVFPSSFYKLSLLRVYWKSFLNGLFFILQFTPIFILMNITMESFMVCPSLSALRHWKIFYI